MKRRWSDPGEHLDAGADHVAVSVTADASAPFSLDQWQALAEQLL